MVHLKLIHELVEHSADHADLLAVDWVLLPVANPDGYVYSHTNDRFWRKTRSINAGSTCVGVDLNRNFAYQWDAPGGASDNPCSEAYRGTNANSEVETRILSALMQQYPNTRIYAAIHSFGQYILYPWGYDWIYIDNADEHQSLADASAGAIYAVQGTVYQTGNSAFLLYIASGATDDFAAGGAGINLAFTWELPGGGSSGFDLPEYRIQTVVEETFAGLRQLGLYADRTWNN